MFSTEPHVIHILEDLDAIERSADSEHRAELIDGLRTKVARIRSLAEPIADISAHQALEQALLRLLRSTSPRAGIPTFLRAVGTAIEQSLSTTTSIYVQILQPSITGDSLRISYSTTDGHIKQPVPINKSIAGRAYRRRETQYVPDIARDTEYNAFFTDSKSEIAVPVKYGKTTLGVLNIESPKVGVFSHRSIRAAEQIAAYMVPLLAISLFEERRTIQPALNYLGVQAVSIWHKVRGDVLDVAYRLAEQPNLQQECEELIAAAHKLRQLFDTRKSLLEKFEAHQLVESLAEGRAFFVNDVPKEKYFVRGLGLRECLELILSNVDAHCPPGTNIKVTAVPSEDGSTVTLVFADDGPGIEEQRLRELRQQICREEIPGQEGLGLWIAEKSLRIVSGHIEVFSDIKKGTKVLVTLPQVRGDS